MASRHKGEHQLSVIEVFESNRTARSVITRASEAFGPGPHRFIYDGGGIVIPYVHRDLSLQRAEHDTLEKSFLRLSSRNVADEEDSLIERPLSRP
ncbi:hypothetical protein EVAR_55415_1 [Eumeta japonica]|uniref:Uncharacterized protein n=1 Tax=Eumeta variegata TaxID=151549 RepID=A0A4C1Z710_EUMVA|nr:hypothetical protein EVAR_55415_1 [Eumeta japonica]